MEEQLTKTPEVGASVTIPVLINEIKLNYATNTYTIAGILHAHNTEPELQYKGQGIEPQVRKDGKLAYYDLAGKITAEIHDEFETYYRVEVKLNDKLVTYYMDAADFVCQE